MDSLQTSTNNTQIIVLDAEVTTLKQQFDAVLRDELANAPSPARDVDHKIETHPDSKPPHRVIFQLPPFALIATKDYVTDLFRIWRRLGNFPYMAP